ncbi:hypothetical protein PsorP6_018007 [Peronosclerospora sorghi]|uniref:Uncharacterized protein n=1 Tax=Peronosclerospora sorghi TaxID=230839 RepID=A0ACC0WCI9_9STRA|nr:hypothetical protein PsorP6_018007 [Peronosclerospora sorghi]
MLYKEETARWLENHTTRSVNGEREARDELTLFEPVEEEQESLADDTINSVFVFASRGNGGQAQWGALYNDSAAGNATMSMSVINAHAGECEEIEMDFVPYRALKSRLHRLLDMA